MIIPASRVGEQQVLDKILETFLGKTGISLFANSFPMIRENSMDQRYS